MKLVAPVLALGLVVASCGGPPPATDAELAMMCAHLEKLRKNVHIPTDQDACIAEAKKEEVSRRQAQCRIQAVNTTEYWVRCRTGAPSTP